jgi:hypothetical protein
VARAQVQLAAMVDAGPDSDAEELAELAQRLRGQLLELDASQAGRLTLATPLLDPDLGRGGHGYSAMWLISSHAAEITFRASSPRSVKR